MRAAATVLLLRESAGELEVLMMRRGAGLAFMAGMWVFPGGRLDAADASPETLARLGPAPATSAGAALHATDGAPLDAGQVAALQVAACRETFEEAGVLLARDADGRPCAPECVARLQPRRAQVTQDPSSFIGMLEAERLRLDTSSLVYWSHWITPSVEPKRFDTRFFAVAVPPGQDASADLSELTHHAWVQPARVEEAMARGEIRVVPPTLLTLEDLAESHARHGGLEAMLTAERGRPTPAVMPRIQVSADEFRVVMPWDTGYASAPGEGCVPAGGFPPHLTRRRSCLVVARSRETR
jgi:8-oxo-dGTP pyrophosphatase MutT (NUDIX family)